MPVSDPTSVDQIASGPDGRVVLAMTEDRSYAGGDPGVMAEEFRAKLNAYVQMIRSGQLTEVLGSDAPRGIDVVLYVVDEPPGEVQRMILLANQGLSRAGVRVGWQLLPPPGREELLRSLAASVAERAPDGWKRADLSVSLVGDGMSGGLTATLASGQTVPMEPDQALVEALQGLKRVSWTPQAGTWVSATFRIDAGGMIVPTLNFDDPAGADFPAVEFATELGRYPREHVPPWWPRPADS